MGLDEVSRHLWMRAHRGTETVKQVVTRENRGIMLCHYSVATR
jgi:hypothetical protein